MKTFRPCPVLAALFALASPAAFSFAIPTASKSETPIPVSLRPYSSSFTQPSPPIVASEFRANFNQHKWDQKLSHITTGFLYSSASLAKVRVDEAYDGALASSLFNFNNVTADGLALNSFWELSPAVTSQPTCQQYRVNSDFPLIPGDFLVNANAVFGGQRLDQFNGVVSEWDIIYQGALPVTVLVDAENTVVGYEYFSPVERTRVITTFFNVNLGKIDAKVFDFPC